MSEVTEEKAAPTGTTPGSDDWSQSRRPLASLLFAGPLLVVYETGLIFLGPSAPRNGADAWLRTFLSNLGFRQQLDYFLLPLLTVSILLAGQYVSRQPWRVPRRVVAGMAGEALLLAAALWFSYRVYHFFMVAAANSVGLSVERGGFSGWLGTMNSYFGAGIYEELLFRMILLNFAAGLLVWLGVKRRAGLVSGVILSSLLFSAAHYVGPSGDKFQWLSFCFRFLAGAFFAVLYCFRGFGIAAGAHAFYDVLVQFSLSAAG